MSGEPYDVQGEVRDALSTSVDSYGKRVLNDPRVLGNLVADLLPDLPRERSLLVTAAEAGIAAELTSNVEGQHMDADTAVALAARSLSENRSLDATAATWVATAYARALGYQVRSQAPPAWDSAAAAAPDTSSPGYEPTMTTNAAPVGWPPADTPPSSNPPASPWGAPASAGSDQPWAAPAAAAWGQSSNPSAQPGASDQPSPWGAPAGAGSGSDQPWAAPTAAAWGQTSAPAQNPAGPPGSSDQPSPWGAPAAGASGTPSYGAPSGTPSYGGPAGGTPSYGGPVGLGSQASGGPGTAGPGGPSYPPGGAASPWQPAGGQGGPGGPWPSATPPGQPKSRRGLIVGSGVVVGIVVLYLIAAAATSVFPFAKSGNPSPVSIGTPTPTPLTGTSKGTGASSPAASPSDSATPSSTATGTLTAGVKPLKVLMPYDLQDVNTECETQAKIPFTTAGLVRGIECVAPDMSSGQIFGYQLDNHADYLKTWANYNTWSQFGTSNTLVCPPSSGNSQGGPGQWWGPRFAKKAGQVLECFTSSTGPVYVWTYPSENTFIIAQPPKSWTFSKLETWWEDNAV